MGYGVKSLNVCFVFGLRRGCSGEAVIGDVPRDFSAFVQAHPQRAAWPELCNDSRRLHSPIALERFLFRTAAVRQSRLRIVGDNEVLLGPFGPYMSNVEVLLFPVMAELLRNINRARVLFVGECGERYQEALRRQVPEAATRVLASGVGAEHDVTCHIAAGDAMFHFTPVA